AAFAFSGLLLSYFMAQRIRSGEWTLRLVLAGIAISALFSSGVGLLKYLADPLQELPEIVFWMLGGLWAITWNDLLIILPGTTVSLVVLYLMRWRLNLLSLRDETVFSLGAAPARERTLILMAAVVATASVVAVAGVVGWIGLIVPHIARRLVGADARRTIPASMLLGGLFTLLCDNLARTLLAGEIPLGIITSLLGALIFIVMLSSKTLEVTK
ncbi:MAG: iron ABC transporter permease, partial [Chloroflexi bacterium]